MKKYPISCLVLLMLVFHPSLSEAAESSVSVAVNSDEQLEKIPSDSQASNVPTKAKAVTRDVINEANADPVALRNAKSVVEPALNKAYSKERLGYQSGSVVSWKVTDSTTHSGTDMMGSSSFLKYSGNTELSGNIAQTSADGTVRFNYDRTSQLASLTRLKNAPTSLETGQSLTYSYDVYYAYQTWKWVVGWVRVEDRYGTVPQQSQLTNLLLEKPPVVVAKPVDPVVEIEQHEALAPLEDYLSVSGTMTGGKLTYEWLEKPSIAILGKQVAKVRVTDTLGSYRNTSEISFSFNVVIPGSVSIDAPSQLNFEPYQLNGRDSLVRRQDPNWSLVIKDTRRPKKANHPWRLTAKALSSTDGLEEYLTYIDETGEAHSLRDTTLIIEGGETGETTINWQENQGIVLTVPASNQLTPGKISQTSIIWNINEGP